MGDLHLRSSTSCRMSRMPGVTVRSTAASWKAPKPMLPYPQLQNSYFKASNKHALRLLILHSV